MAVDILLVDADEGFRNFLEERLRLGFERRPFNGDFNFVHATGYVDFLQRVNSGNGSLKDVSLAVVSDFESLKLANDNRIPPILFYSELKLVQLLKMEASRGAVGYFGRNNYFDDIHFTDLALEILQNGSNPVS